MNARNGKIARLPRPVRHELNERLDCSEESPELLEWLNALPEVKAEVRKYFAGVPVSKQNLSQWRLGGFEEWLARRDLRENAGELAQLAQEMDEEGLDGVFADDAAQVLAVRFGSLIANWNGEVDEKFEAKSRVLNRLCRSVVQLQRGMHRSNREAFELTGKLEEKEKAGQAAIQERLVKPFYDMLAEPALVSLFGGGTVGRKIARFIQSVQRGKLDAKLDLLPTDQYAGQEQAEIKVEKVKPAPRPRQVSRAGKTGAEKAAKPLAANAMDHGREEEPNPGQSESVTVGQSDLRPAVAEASAFAPPGGTATDGTAGKSGT